MHSPVRGFKPTFKYDDEDETRVKYFLNKNGIHYRFSFIIYYYKMS